jgi:hypothetical protein
MLKDGHDCFRLISMRVNYAEGVRQLQPRMKSWDQVLVPYHWERGRPRPHRAESAKSFPKHFGNRIQVSSRLALGAGEGARAPSNKLG